MDHNRNSIYNVMMNFKILIFSNQFNSFDEESNYILLNI